ncbi:MAG: DUF5906 domain-containing protein, partial [Oscillospiraceae bacterium]|nr:DUF5906 domain-containing protein [Oscillospiraceae bacterium]
IGVVISGYNPKKFFVLLGAKNSGKSQFLILLSLFVGVICTMSVNDVNDFGSNKFLAGELVGKKLCICADLPRNILSDKALAILKQLTGGDMLQGERKYRDPFFFHNEASLVIGANHAISHSHYDDAFDSRMITVPFLRSVPQSEQIPNISARLIEEAGYIIFHACEALRELVGRNFEFTVVDADYWTNDTIIGGDLIADFIEAECVLDTEANTSTRELFERFGEFCGGTSSMPVTIFARKLSQVYGFETWRTNEKRGFRGIRLVTGAVPNHSKTE